MQLDLTEYVIQNLKLTSQSAKIIADKMVLKELTKGEVFVKRDFSNTMEYIVVDGICRSYLEDIHGTDITLSFFTKGNAVAPNLTRALEGKSMINIQALSDVTLACFKSEDLIQLMGTNREIEIWANTVLQKVLLDKVRKEVNQISLSASERLLDFRNNHPPLENLISHSYIASYLGITTVSLSRIRKSLAS